MADEARASLTEQEAIEALTHPVRLNLLDHLMAAGPATASQCARAVGDTPSNCSYHLRVLAKHGWVAAEASGDGRERPWRALITGLSLDGLTDDPDSPRGRSAAALLALTVQQDQLLARAALARFGKLPRAWREASAYHTYTLRMTAAELTGLASQLDALIRPYLAATRENPAPGAQLVHFGLHAFPKGPPK